MDAHIDVEHSLVTQEDKREDDTVDAEFVEQESSIRRAPEAGGPVVENPAPGRISMALEDWLEVDHTLHELYNLVEIAIAQRDDAMEQKERSESTRQVTASRLVEWKTYARKLEKVLTDARIENLALEHRIERVADLADESLGLGVFDGKRKRELGDKLAEIKS